MKRTAAVVFLMLACAACAGTMDWRYGKPGRVVVTNEEDAAALSAISALSTQGLARVRDTAQPSRYLLGLSNGTGTVYEVTGPFTNLMVTLSEDFEETVTHTRPAWTNNVFPFADGNWSSQILSDKYSIAVSTSESFWLSESLALPATLTASGDAQGTATVSFGGTYYVTNAIKHLASEAEIETAKSQCLAVLSSATNALVPYTRTVYADITKTNDTGYAAFNATNAAVSSYSALIPSSAVGSFTNTFRYYLNDIRKTGVLTNKAWFVKYGFGAGYKAVSTVVSVKDAAGNVLASSASQPVNIDQTVTTPAAITNTLALPLNVYSGTVEVACIAVSTNAAFSVRLYTGGQYASALSFGEAPIPYATVGDVSGLRLGGATNITDGVTSGTYTEATRTFDIGAITKKITKPIISSATNVVVTATNAVYSVTATGSGAVGIDWSGLALDGTKRAEVLLRVNVSQWGGTNVTFSPSMTFDIAPEVLVTGVWEFACSTIDGATTKVRQTWPEIRIWQPANVSNSGSGVDIGTWFEFSAGTTNYVYMPSFEEELFLTKLIMESAANADKTQTIYVAYANAGNTAFADSTIVHQTVFSEFWAGWYTRRFVIPFPAPGEGQRGVKLWVAANLITARIDTIRLRPLNSLERAAYAAGWRP